MKKCNLILTSIISLATISCNTVNPYTGESQYSKAATGSLLGALGGAATGALLGKNRGGGRTGKYAALGALAGAAAGGGIGVYMDQQEMQIRQQLEGTGVSVTRVGENLILNLPSDITFRTGSSTIDPGFNQTLRSVALVLEKYGKTNISITGHTDSDGGTGYNQLLSESRAQAVGRVLQLNKVDLNRIFTQGSGESSPIASNKSARGKALNRRVVLKIMPKNNQFR